MRDFVESNHYSKSINGCKVCAAFALYDADTLVGAAIFGALSTTAWKRYGAAEADVVELRRLVCLDACPKNTESWFVARCLKALKTKKVAKVCVSYADPHQSHVGIIYQASNWQYHGTTAPDVLLQTPDGRLYHSRAMRTSYKGALKPFAARLKALHDAGELVRVRVPGKHIYTYNLVGRQSPTKVPYPKPEIY